MSARNLFLKAGAAALLTAAAMAFGVGSAEAHTPYVVPYTFSPERDYVGVQGGMSEEAAFVPDFAIRGNGDWTVVGPDGVATKVPQTAFKSVVIVEAPLPAQGTYRIGTGERPGRAGKAALVDGVWRQVRPAPAGGAPAGPARPRPMDDDEGGAGPIDAGDVPAGAQTVETQGFMIAETYVSRGAPTPGALKASGKGFELEPITHPNEIFLDEGFTFRALVDGKPVAGLKLTVYRGGEGYEDGKRTAIEATTAADGKATIKFEKPGVYMLETRYPGQAGPGQQPAARSWVYTLSFEVTQ